MGDDIALSHSEREVARLFMKRAVVGDADISDEDLHSLKLYAHIEDDIVSWKPAPWRSVSGSVRWVGGRPSQSACRSHSAGPFPSDSQVKGKEQARGNGEERGVELRGSMEELYAQLGIILPASLAMFAVNDGDSGFLRDMNNDTVALWAEANSVTAMHVVALASQLRVRCRFEGTLKLGDATAWMESRRSSHVEEKSAGRDEGESFSKHLQKQGSLRKKVSGFVSDAFQQAGQPLPHRARSLRKKVAKEREEARGQMVPLAVVMLYSDICGVDVTRRGGWAGKGDAEGLEGEFLAGE